MVHLLLISAGIYGNMYFFHLVWLNWNTCKIQQMQKCDVRWFVQLLCKYSNEKITLYPNLNSLLRLKFLLLRHFQVQLNNVPGKCNNLVRISQLGGLIAIYENLATHRANKHLLLYLHWIFRLIFANNSKICVNAFLIFIQRSYFGWGTAAKMKLIARAEMI